MKTLLVKYLLNFFKHPVKKLFNMYVLRFLFENYDVKISKYLNLYRYDHVPKNVALLYARIYIRKRAIPPLTLN